MQRQVLDEQRGLAAGRNAGVEAGELAARVDAADDAGADRLAARPGRHRRRGPRRGTAPPSRCRGQSRAARWRGRARRVPPAPPCARSTKATRPRSIASSATATRQGGAAALAAREALAADAAVAGGAAFAAAAAGAAGALRDDSGTIIVAALARQRSKPPALAVALAFALDAPARRVQRETADRCGAGDSVDARIAGLDRLGHAPRERRRRPGPGVPGRAAARRSSVAARRSPARQPTSRSALSSPASGGTRTLRR